MQIINFNKTVLLASSLLIIGIAVVAAKWTWSFLYSEELPPVTQQVTSKTLSVNTKPQMKPNYLKVVLSAHLFGKKELEKKQIIQEVIPKSTQRLELHGVFYSPENPKSSRALIAAQGKIAESYREGDELKNARGKIYKILESSVQIELNGKLEQIELSKLSNNTGTIEFTPAPASSISSPKNNTSLLKSLGLQKTSKGVVLSGSKKFPLGLKKSDVIVSVNDYDFEDLEQNPDLLNDLLAQESVEVKILRNGNEIYVKVPESILSSWRKSIKNKNIRFN